MRNAEVYRLIYGEGATPAHCPPPQPFTDIRRSGDVDSP